jgi:photosystem II stability/assembly factor-like uncharacterized protein
MLDVPDIDKWLFPRSVAHIKHIASHPAEPETLYLCVEQGDLLKTSDDGKTWRQLTSVDRPSDIYRRDMHRVTIRSDNPRELFLTTGIGLYHSLDGGDTWDNLTDSDYKLCYPDPLFIDPANPSRLHMVGAGVAPGPKWAELGTAHPYIMRSDDNGRTWTEAMEGIRRPVRGNIEAAAMHTSGEAGTEFFVGTACGELYTTHDDSPRWEMISDALPAVSKGPHFRHFLQPEDRARYEEDLRSIGAFA